MKWTSEILFSDTNDTFYLSLLKQSSGRPITLAASESNIKNLGFINDLIHAGKFYSSKQIMQSDVAMGKANTYENPSHT